MQIPIRLLGLLIKLGGYMENYENYELTENDRKRLAMEYSRLYVFGGCLALFFFGSLFFVSAVFGYVLKNLLMGGF